MSTEFEWHGISEFEAAIAALDVRVEKGSEAGVKAAGKAVADSAASQFGKPPAPVSRTGRLAGSVTIGEVTRVGFGIYQAQAGPSGLDYVRVQELGKKPPRSKPAHPWFFPGAKLAVSALPALYAHEWEKALHGG